MEKSPIQCLETILGCDQALAELLEQRRGVEEERSAAADQLPRALAGIEVPVAGKMDEQTRAMISTAMQVARRPNHDRPARVMEKLLSWVLRSPEADPLGRPIRVAGGRVEIQGSTAFLSLVLRADDQIQPRVELVDSARALINAAGVLAEEVGEVRVVLGAGDAGSLDCFVRIVEEQIEVRFEGRRDGGEEALIAYAELISPSPELAEDDAGSQAVIALIDSAHRDPALNLRSELLDLRSELVCGDEQIRLSLDPIIAEDPWRVSFRLSSTASPKALTAAVRRAIRECSSVVREMAVFTVEAL